MTKSLVLSVTTAILVWLTPLPARGQSPTAMGDQPWWKHAVFYEIYPRSFADSNQDGIGDLKGITSKLDYLRELGIDAIWISPCYPSPQFDFGYDLSDYENIDPMYGSLQDFDELTREAHRRGVRVIMDFVLNHSSHQHPWFLDSKSSRTSAHRDWYIWRSGRPGNLPPNNWQSSFGGSAWQFDSTTGQYYYHYFEVQQPDLNWRNPAVEKAMFDVVRFWHKHGVDGFRLDAVDLLFEDPQLRDNPTKPGTNEFGDPEMINQFNDKLPENHDVLRRLRKLADENGQVLIGETWTENIDELKEYYGSANDEIQLPMDFMFTTVNRLSAPSFRKQIALVESSGGWPVLVIGNHDMPRSYDRYGDGKNNDQIAKLMAALQLTLRGTPIMYYGEEIGMANNDPVRREDVKDPLGQQGWPQQKGRDGERTPMQWNGDLNAGFTAGTPWLPIPASYKTRNVAAESRNSDSVLRFYQRLLELRRTSSALLDGDYEELNSGDPNVLAYLRKSNAQTILVVLNMSASSQSLKLDLTLIGKGAIKPRLLLGAPQKSPARLEKHTLALAPFAVYIAEVRK